MVPHHPAVTPVQEAYNYMYNSRLRICVQWAFGKVVSLFPHVDMFRKQQILLSGSGLGRQYTMLQLCSRTSRLACESGTSQAFDIEPPWDESYINGKG